MIRPSVLCACVLLAAPAARASSVTGCVVDGTVDEVVKDQAGLTLKLVVVAAAGDLCPSVGSRLDFVPDDAATVEAAKLRKGELVGVRELEVFTQAEAPGGVERAHQTRHEFLGRGAHVAPTCDVELSLRVRGREVTAVASNRTAAPLELTLPSRCPEGSIRFAGLPARWDYYGTCTAGMCPPEPPVKVTLPPGTAVDLATIRVAARPPCNPVLPPGRYPITFTLPDGATAAKVCGPSPHVVVVPPPAHARDPR
jgi:hypothetical protein